MARDSKAFLKAHTRFEDWKRSNTRLHADGLLLVEDGPILILDEDSDFHL